MKIQVENFNNITTLELEIKTNKINYLIGSSGTGKSSVAYALSKAPGTENVRIGKAMTDVSVLVDGSIVNHSQFNLFNSEYMKNILIYKSEKQGIYNIVMTDSDEYLRARDQYNIAIEDIRKVEAKIKDLYNLIGKMKADLVQSVNTNGDFHGSSTFKKMEKNVLSFKLQKDLDQSYIAWVKVGMKHDYFTKQDKCPFCKKKITNKVIFEEIDKFDEKTFIKFVNGIDNLKSIGITKPKTITSKWMQKTKSDIKERLLWLNSLESIIRFIDAGKNVGFDIKAMMKSTVAKNIKGVDIEIFEAIKNFNSNFSKVKKVIQRLKKKTDKIVSDNSKELNDKMELLGIPYEFTFNNIDSSKSESSFILSHKLDPDKKDRVSSLSYGEKNIIGLMLFLLANKNESTLIIDDPASSYDEYKRKNILDMIYEFGHNKTILILSHDHIFAKYVIFNLHKNKNNTAIVSNYKSMTGDIYFMEYFDVPNIKIIGQNDFDTLDNFVINNIKKQRRKLIDYRIAINLRLYFETKKGKYGDVYGLLSAMMHRTDYNEILTKVADNGWDLTEIINRINKEVGISFTGVNPKYNNISTDKYTNFEKVIYFRESLKSSKKDRLLASEMSSIIHLNESYVTCLDPFKFDYFSKYIYDKINEK